jgi:hypothetical protein
LFPLQHPLPKKRGRPKSPVSLLPKKQGHPKSPASPLPKKRGRPKSRAFPLPKKQGRSKSSNTSISLPMTIAQNHDLGEKINVEERMSAVLSFFKLWYIRDENHSKMVKGNFNTVIRKISLTKMTNEQKKILRLSFPSLLSLNIVEARKKMREKHIEDLKTSLSIHLEH